MAEELLGFALRSAVTLILVVDPIGVAPMFAGLTRWAAPAERRVILRRAVIIASAVTLFFLFAGRLLLAQLGVTVPAFAISGGILLFVTALPMLFGHRGAMQSPETNEAGGAGEDMAVFPLAIPLLSGPGTITTILLLASRAQTGAAFLVLAPVIVAVFVLSWLVLSYGERLISRLGEAKIHIITRVLGIVLAALAVQYVLDGVGEFIGTLDLTR